MLTVKQGRAVLVYVFIAFTIFLQGTPVSAHAPFIHHIGYTYASHELTLDITHEVDNVTTHYIHQIVIEKNSEVVITRDYTSQNTTSGMTAVFIVEAGIGDILKATAKCVISGEDSEELNLGNVFTGDRTPPDTVVFIISAIVVVGILAVVFVFVKRR